MFGIRDRDGAQPLRRGERSGARARDRPQVMTAFLSPRARAAPSSRPRPGSALGRAGVGLASRARISCQPRRASAPAALVRPARPASGGTAGLMPAGRPALSGADGAGAGPERIGQPARLLLGPGLRFVPSHSESAVAPQSWVARTAGPGAPIRSEPILRAAAPQSWRWAAQGWTSWRRGPAGPGPRTGSTLAGVWRVSEAADASSRPPWQCGAQEPERLEPSLAASLTDTSAF